MIKTHSAEIGQNRSIILFILIDGTLYSKYIVRYVQFGFLLCFLNQSLFNFQWQLTQRAAGDLWTSHKMPIPRFTLCFQSNNKYISKKSKCLLSTTFLSQNSNTSHQNIISTILCRCISPNSHIVLSKINWRSCKMFKSFSEKGNQFNCFLQLLKDCGPLVGSGRHLAAKNKPIYHHSQLLLVRQGENMLKQRKCFEILSSEGMGYT